MNIELSKIQYSFHANNVTGRDRHQLTRYFKDYSITVVINHHMGYDNLEDYRENAYRIEHSADMETQEVLTREEFYSRLQAIEENEGKEAAIIYAADCPAIIDHYFSEQAAELIAQWEAMVFTLKLFSPQVCF